MNILKKRGPGRPPNYLRALWAKHGILKRSRAGRRPGRSRGVPGRSPGRPRGSTKKKPLLHPRIETNKDSLSLMGNDDLNDNKEGTPEHDTTPPGVKPSALSPVLPQNGSTVVEKEPEVKDDRSFWKPPVKPKPVLEQVFITDVTSDRLTVTVRECNSESGFFQSRDEQMNGDKLEINSKDVKADT